MFMTALGSLVFIALLLVFLLPRTSEVFVEGKIENIERKNRNEIRQITLGMPNGNRKFVTVGNSTRFNRQLPLPLPDIKVGEYLIAAGKANPNGSIQASLIEVPLDDEISKK